MPRRHPGNRQRPPSTDPGSRSVATHHGIEVGIVAAIAFAVYANTLLNGFVNDDDQQVLTNPWITNVRFVPDIFSQSQWGFLGRGVTSPFYRPMTYVVYLVNYHLFGLQAWGFHLVNVLFHAANTILIFFLAARLTGAGEEPGSRSRFAAQSPSVPFIAALLFATHPIHTEVVAWVSGLQDLSFTVFFLLSLLLYSHSRDHQTAQNLCHALSVVAFAAAAFCKEPALTLPVVLVVYDVALGKEIAGWGRRHLPYVAVAAVYLMIRSRVLGNIMPNSTHPELDMYHLLINVFRLFSEYVEKLFLPIRLNFRHSFHPIMSLVTVEGMLSVGVVSVVAVAALVLWRKYRLGFFCLALFAVPLAPAFYINVLPADVFAERYLYLPSAGFVILAALLLSRVSAVKSMRMAAIVVLVSTTALYSTGTIRRNRVWKDAYTLFSDTVSKSPDAPTPPYDFAITLLNQGRPDEALARLRILADVSPGDARYQSALGSALLVKGRLDEAIEHLQIALSLAPGSLESYNDLAVALRRRGNAQGAIEQYTRALAIVPEYPEAHFNLGSALVDVGQTQEAMDHYRAAVRLRPESHYYRNVLGIECGKQGLLDEAIEQFQEAVRLAPEEPAYRRNLERASALRSGRESAPSGAENPVPQHTGPETRGRQP